MPEKFTEGMPPVGVGPAAPSGTPSTGPVATAAPRVTALVVVRNGSAWLAQCLDAVAAQTLPPDRVVVLDVASSDTSAAIARAHARLRAAVPDTTVMTLDEPMPIGRAVDHAIAHAILASPGTNPVHGSNGEHVSNGGHGSAGANGASSPTARDWVWIVHDDSAPQAGALRQLLETARRSPSVGVAGPKLVEWEDPRRLVELGIQVTRSGRRLPSPQRGEADQGQHDHREDALAVSTSGMLLRLDVHADLGGFDRGFAGAGSDLDLGWRAQLAGHRVIVVPAAKVLEARAGLDGERPGGRRPGELVRASRTAARRVALARCSPVAAPFLALWIALSAVVGALVLLVLKRPGRAWEELGDLRALAHPVAIARARWRGRRAVRLRRGHIGTLFVGAGQATRAAFDAVQEAVAPDRRRAVREAAPTTETGPSDEGSESLGALPASLARRVATHPGVLAVLATVAATVMAWRTGISSGALSPASTGIAGGELRPVTSGADGLWHAFRDAWHGAGLGTGAESSPHLAVLAALTWVAERIPGVSDGRSPAGLTIAWIIFLGPAASAWSAYLAGRVVTRSRTTRAVVALLWGTSAVATVAALDGRLSAVAAHVVLPFVLAGHVLVARRDGTFTGAFATALAAAVLGALAPPLLVVSTVAALVLLLAGPGSRRLRALVVLLVPIGLLGPWVTVVLADWRRVLSGPGLLTTAAAPDPWRLLLGLPDTTSHTGWTAFVFAPVLVVGVAGYALRARSRPESVGLAVAALLALLGLAGAVASARVTLGSAETGAGTSAAAHLWPGVFLDLWVAGLLVGVLAGGRAVIGSLRDGRSRWWRASGAVLLALVVAVAVAQAVSLGSREVSRTLSVEDATLPAVALEQSGDPLSNRLLVVRPGDRVVDVVLVGREPGEVLRDLDRPASVDAQPLLDAVGAVVGGPLSETVDATPLARLGIGFVQVRAQADSDLVRRLDAAKGLTRLGAGEHGILWKVRPVAAASGATSVPAPSRMRLADSSGRSLDVVPTTGPHAAASAQVAAGPDGRLLVVAEPREWLQHAVVAFDGHPLTPVEGAAQPTFVVPATAGTITVDLATAQPWWRLGQAALLALAVFMALPFGNRRSRRPQR